MQKLKLLPHTNSIPIILCAVASKLIDEQEEDLRQNGIQLIYKTFELDKLLQNIRHLLGRRGVE
jgi:hypothetical protein